MEDTSEPKPDPSGECPSTVSTFAEKFTCGPCAAMQVLMSRGAALPLRLQEIAEGHSPSCRPPPYPSAVLRVFASELVRLRSHVENLNW